MFVENIHNNNNNNNNHNTNYNHLEKLYSENEYYKSSLINKIYKNISKIKYIDYYMYLSVINEHLFKDKKLTNNILNNKFNNILKIYENV